MAQILVVNPNSNPEVTAGLSRALAGQPDLEGAAVECLTLAEGPFGIESDADVAAVVPLLRDLAATRRDAAAIVLACFSDPGLAELGGGARNIFGIRECAIRTALAAGKRFAIAALGAQSIQRHGEAVRQMGAEGMLAGIRALNLTVAQSESAASYPRILEIGTELRDLDGATAIILGCAGMSRHRAALESDLGIMVIDPTVAAVRTAIAAAVTPAV